jgi:hypothetical protein
MEPRYPEAQHRWVDATETMQVYQVREGVAGLLVVWSAAVHGCDGVEGSVHLHLHEHYDPGVTTAAPTAHAMLSPDMCLNPPRPALRPHNTPRQPGRMIRLCMLGEVHFCVGHINKHYSQHQACTPAAEAPRLCALISCLCHMQSCHDGVTDFTCANRTKLWTMDIM